MTEELNRFQRIKSLLQDTNLIDSHTISLVVAECDMALTQRPAAQTDSMGMPTSCGKPLCSPDEHHPLCKLHKPAAQATPEPVQPFLVRDVAALLGASVPDVCKALVHLGHGQRSTNMEIKPEEALAVAEHIRAKAATPESVGEPVFLVATGEIYEGEETYQRYEGSPPPLCDFEVLYTRPAPGVPEGFALVPITDLQALAKRAHELRDRQYDVSGSALLGDDKVKNFREQQPLVYAVACEVGAGLFCLADDLPALAAAQAKAG